MNNYKKEVIEYSDELLNIEQLNKIKKKHNKLNGKSSTNEFDSFILFILNICVLKTKMSVKKLLVKGEKSRI